MLRKIKFYYYLNLLKPFPFRRWILTFNEANNLLKKRTTFNLFTSVKYLLCMNFANYFADSGAVLKYVMNLHDPRDCGKESLYQIWWKSVKICDLYTYPDTYPIQYILVFFTIGIESKSLCLFKISEFKKYSSMLL